MNWSDVRNYIISRINVVDPDLREWRESFNIDNVPSTLLDTHFQITFNNIAQDANQGNYVVDTINVTLNIWKNGCNEPVDALDCLLDKALCIRQDVVNPLNVEEFGWNGSVNAVSVVPFPVDETNDDVIKVSVELDIINYLII